MNPGAFLLALCCAMAAASADPQLYSSNHPWADVNYLRSGIVASNSNNQPDLEGRFFLITQTFTIATSTFTTTQTTSTTCTTSTAALTVCSPSGGRKKRSSNKARQLYSDSDDVEVENVFLPSSDRYKQKQDGRISARARIH